MPNPDFWDHFSRGIAEVAKEYDHSVAQYAWDLVPVGIAVVELDGMYLHINKVFRDTLGYKLDDVVGVLSFWDLTTPDTLPATRRSVEARDNFGNFGWLNKAYIHKNGSHIPCRIRGQVVETARSGEIVVVVLDFL